MRKRIRHEIYSLNSRLITNGYEISKPDNKTE